MSAEKIPMIGKGNIGLVVAQVDQQAIAPIEKQNHGDFFHRGPIKLFHP
jgi:hypothetical protein